MLMIKLTNSTKFALIILLFNEGTVKMGVIINALSIAIAGSLGLLINTGIPTRFHERLMQGVALCVVAIGITGTIAGSNTLIMIISIVLGTVIGEGIDIDKKVINAIQFFESKVQHSDKVGNLGQGFISASMIFCIGSMAILGSLELGLTGDNTTLITKSILDGITSILLGSSLGAGVILAAIPVLILQGGITLLAGFLAPFLSQAIIAEMIAVGSLLLIGLGLNMLEVTQLKIMNFTPAMFLPPILMLIFL